MKRLNMGIADSSHDTCNWEVYFSFSHTLPVSIPASPSCTHIEWVPFPPRWCMSCIALLLPTSLCEFSVFSANGCYLSCSLYWRFFFSSRYLLSIISTQASTSAVIYGRHSISVPKKDKSSVFLALLIAAFKTNHFWNSESFWTGSKHGT